jgi:hypothetical protein
MVITNSILVKRRTDIKTAIETSVSRYLFNDSSRSIIMPMRPAYLAHLKTH